jgi:hypothetical protein
MLLRQVGASLQRGIIEAHNTVASQGLSVMMMSIAPGRSTPLLVSIGGIWREYTIEDRVWQYIFET